MKELIILIQNFETFQSIVSEVHSEQLFLQVYKEQNKPQQIIQEQEDIIKYLNEKHNNLANTIHSSIKGELKTILELNNFDINESLETIIYKLNDLKKNLN